MFKVGFLYTPEPTQIHKELEPTQIHKDQSIIPMFTCVTGEPKPDMVILFLLNILQHFYIYYLYFKKAENSVIFPYIFFTKKIYRGSIIVSYKQKDI